MLSKDNNEKFDNQDFNGDKDYDEDRDNAAKENFQENNQGNKLGNIQGENSGRDDPGDRSPDSPDSENFAGEKKENYRQEDREDSGSTAGNSKKGAGRNKPDFDGKIPLEAGSWLTGEGPDKDIVISSRIRLARNLVGMPFPNRAGEQILEGIEDSVGEMLLEFGRTGLTRFDLEERDQLEKQVLVERHLISRQQSQSLTGRAVYINQEQSISIMVNEEDHLRLQFISPGQNLSPGWELASSYDDLLDERLDFAFDRQYGYLTACPTNIGTGLRASVMLHLPGLSLAGSIDKLLGSIGKFGLTFRGIYGEGSEAEGSIYQLSNQVTLGRSEEEIIDNLESILSQIKDHEHRAREELMRKQEFKMKDKIMRAYGTLKHAYQIDSMEAVKLISLLLLGVYYDLVPLERRQLLELLIMTRTAHLQYCCSQEMTAAQRDVSRAELFRRELA